MNKPLLSRLQKLRSQIEVSAPPPAIIMVTSATTDDGSTIAAARIADCLAAAGSSVALLCSSLEHATRDGGRSPISILVLAKELRPIGRSGDAVARLVDRMRQDYDYTVVDAPPLADSNISMRLAQSADAVLLSVRVGRSSCAEDQLMMEALQMAGARVLGVIGASEATVRGSNGADPVAEALVDVAPSHKRKSVPTSAPLATMP